MSDAVALRPLGVGDILDEAFRIYRRNVRYLVTLTAATFAPLAVIGALLGALGSMVAGPVGVGIAALLGGLLGGLGGLVIFGALMYAIAELRRGRRPSIGEPIRRALSRLPAMLGLGLVLFVAILLLLITIVGWIWASVLWSMAYPVLVLEGGGVMHALSRSRQLVRGSWWRVFGILLLIWLIYAFISFVIVLVGAAVAGLLAFAGESTPVALGQAIVQLVFSVAQQALTQPFSVAGTVLLYYDLRVRKEGLDLQERAEGLLAAGAPASP